MWSFHRELRMRASLPVNHQLKVFFILRRFKSEVQQGSIDGMAE
jgi:hypothetical protein